MEPQQSNEPQTVSQTGAAETPLQVENVQYNVDVKDYKSKPALVFSIANTSMAIGLFLLAATLYNVTGMMLGFEEDNNLQFLISALIPVTIIGVIAVRRFSALIAEQPGALEDIKFKGRLRKSFLFFLTLAGLGSFVAIFNFIGIFIEIDEDTVKNSFVSLYFVGGLIVMTLWLYHYQKLTKR